MKKYFVDFLLVIVPLLLVVVGVNYYGDPAHKFDNDYEQKIVDILDDGRNATNVDNCSERLLKNLLIGAKEGEHYKWAVYSSSRGMTISGFETGVNLINLGVSSATAMDYIAIDYLCDKNRLSFDNVIVVIDPYFLCDAKQNSRWKENQHIFNEAMNFPLVEEKRECSWTDLFSVTYFQASLKLLLMGKKKLKSTEITDNEGQTVLSDGSISYPERIRNKAQSDIDYEAGQNKSDVYKEFNILSEQLMPLFEELVVRLQRKKVNIYFYEAPLHPLVYANIKDIRGIKLQKDFFKALAKKYNVQYLGSFNPADCNCDNHSFYDADHMRRDVINKIMKEEIIK
jgi:hypothetical protein